MQYTFPDAGAGADPRAVLDSHLAQLGKATGTSPSDDFLPTLRVVAEAISRAGDARLESLSYRAGVFDLQVRAPNAETLDQIRQFVTADGTRTAEIQSANAEGDQVQGRLRIAVPAAAAQPGGRA
jgi:type II secretory pathway component PulL